MEYGPLLLPVTIAAIVASGTAILTALLIRRLVSPSRWELVTAEWLGQFSVEKYRPMERLLADEDFRFLAAQKGCRARLAARLRRQRIKVFRGYLKRLRGDYRKLEAALGLWMANSPNDRPDLARYLLKRRLSFSFAVLTAEWRLILFGFGLGPADVRRLVATLDDMRGDLRRTALVRQATPA